MDKKILMLIYSHPVLSHSDNSSFFFSALLSPHFMNELIAYTYFTARSPTTISHALFVCATHIQIPWTYLPMMSSARGSCGRREKYWIALQWGNGYRLKDSSCPTSDTCEGYRCSFTADFGTRLKADMSSLIRLKPTKVLGVLSFQSGHILALPIIHVRPHMWCLAISLDT